MILCDVNVFVDAFREDARDFSKLNPWFNGVLNGNESYAVSDIILSGFLRIVTHPRIFTLPTPLAEALKFVEMIREQPHAVIVYPGPNHWNIFTDLCQKVDARAGHITDAFLAALAIESGSEMVTSDRDFSRYPGLRWRHPLDSE